MRGHPRNGPAAVEVGGGRLEPSDEADEVPVGGVAAVRLAEIGDEVGRELLSMDVVELDVRMPVGEVPPDEVAVEAV